MNLFEKIMGGKRKQSNEERPPSRVSVVLNKDKRGEHTHPPVSEPDVIAQIEVETLDEVARKLADSCVFHVERPKIEGDLTAEDRSGKWKRYRDMVFSMLIAGTGNKETSLWLPNVYRDLSTIDSEHTRTFTINGQKVRISELLSALRHAGDTQFKYSDGSPMVVDHLLRRNLEKIYKDYFQIQRTFTQR